MNQSLTVGRNIHHKSSKVGLNIHRTICYIVLIIMAFCCLFPFYIMLVNCTRSNYEIQNTFSLAFGSFLVKNLQNLFNNEQYPIAQATLNSAWIALVCACLTVYFSALTAYATHIYTFKGKKAISTFIIAIMMIPTQVAALGSILMYYQIQKYTGIKMMDTFIPIVLPSICAPVTYFYLKQYMDSVLPTEVIEAARVDGSTEIGIFHKMVLPMIKPALSVQFIFSFVGSWNNYFMPSMILTSKKNWTLPILISQLKASDPSTFDYGQIYCLMTIAVLPLIVVYFIFSRYIIKGLTSGAVKG
ncbi:MAG: carbohydrate ABC transporter permease [Bacilli bacterium]